MTPQPPPVDAEDDLMRILPLSPSHSLHKDPRPPTATPRLTAWWSCWRCPVAAAGGHWAAWATPAGSSSC